jgi:hypothetical protein
VAVRIAGARRRDRDPRPDRIDEGLRRGRPAPVMGHLQHVYTRQPFVEQRGIDVLLDIAGEQEAAIADLAEEDDRDVVDTRAAVGGLGRHVTADRPQHAERHLVDPQSVAGRETEPDRRAGSRQALGPRRVARAGTAHAGFEHLSDAIALEEQGQAGDVVLVRMREHDRIDPSVPRRDVLVEDDEESIGARAAIDEQSTAT